MAKNKRQVEAIVSAMGVFMSIISSLAELVKKFGGTMENIYRLATPEGSETLETIARIIVDGDSRVRAKFLRLISGDENLIINECDGSRIIANAKDTFAYIDSDFKNWGADEKDPATKETPVQVYEMEKDGTFSELFSSLLPFDPRKMCLTQDQILSFVRKYRDWLSPDSGTFFLFQSKEHFFVSNVNFNSDGKLRVYVSRLEDGYVWYAKNRHRVVVPRLA